jgi:hypothetical protein
MYEMFCNVLPKVQISFSDIYYGFENAPVVMWDTQIRYDSMYAVPKLRHQTETDFLKMEEILSKAIKSVETKEKTQVIEMMNDSLNTNFISVQNVSTSIKSPVIGPHDFPAYVLEIYHCIDRFNDGVKSSNHIPYNPISEFEDKTRQSQYDDYAMFVNQFPSHTNIIKK